ncbi:protein translocase subunit secF [Paraperlucidibaca baekdonensis]|uniref:Protein-export membrane protein SecF n=1 Tax=Paraperlucidibaca baekdonensis TaxID=748120 RepID=A0A3E0H700_9GAMM|nr:protein translocase subunit SecF [Paraperlucidibaca baekdonensis]REH38804.1 protein translocase subunit secF [Paraperlucidibaca baekdonensis]
MSDVHIIRFMRFRRAMAYVSGAVVIIGLVSLFTQGLNLGLDFTGGTAIELRFEQAAHQSEVSEALEKAGINDAVVQYLGGANTIQVRLPPQPGEATIVGQRIAEAVSTPGNTAVVQQIDSVGSQVGDEQYTQSVIAITLALGLMMLYVAIRYRFKFAVGAVISLFHDVIFTVGVFSLFQLPFDLTVLAAVLALIGYSLNDTIVVFDRVRENFRKLRKADPTEIVDISLTETLRRTIMTVATVIVVVLAMLIAGGSALHWFSVALLVGLFAGTYSSIYIASAYALAMGLSKEDFIIEVKKAEDDLP